MADDDFNKVFGARRPNFAEQFAPRRGEPREPAPPSAAPASAEYRPYGTLPTSGLGESCEVTWWMDRTAIPEGIVFQYRFLMQVGFVGEEELRLFLPDCIVLIQGKRLKELRERLARRQVTFICEYNPRVWPTSPPPREPFIERIQVVRPEAAAGRS